MQVVSTAMVTTTAKSSNSRDRLLQSKSSFSVVGDFASSLLVKAGQLEKTTCARSSNCGRKALEALSVETNWFAS